MLSRFQNIDLSNKSQCEGLRDDLAQIIEKKEILKQQADSHAAQSAIKLSVYQPPEAVREAVRFEVFDDTKDSVKTIVDKWKKS